jgi:Cu+-exporting ATPase
VLGGQEENEVLRLAAGVERASEHPLAAAIVRAAEERGLPTPRADSFQSLTGRGIKAVVEGREVLVGNTRLLRERGIENQEPTQSESSGDPGATNVFVAVDGRLVGVIGIVDPVKPSTPAALQELRREGIQVVMLTGDSRANATAIARQLGLDNFEAEVLPEKKSQAVKLLQSQGKIVAMAGDGINDAPALAQANVGIAMGTGTDVAMESGGITLVKGDLRGIVRARRLSRATMRNIRQNLFFAFIYNSLGVPIAAGILYPSFGLLLSPIIAAVAMSFSSVSVITNALRLRKAAL